MTKNKPLLSVSEIRKELEGIAKHVDGEKYALEEEWRGPEYKDFEHEQKEIVFHKMHRIWYLVMALHAKTVPGKEKKIVNVK